jgi:hypothetical protein
MATEIIHEHDVSANNNNNFSLIFGIIAIVFIVLVALYFFRGALNFGTAQTSPQVNVPDKVNVNVNKK